MSKISFKTEMSGTLEEVITKLSQELQKEGFSILTRIDFHTKIKEKLGKELLPIIILGACNPNMAYEAYMANHDVTNILPCNAVLRELPSGKFSVELAKATSLMKVLEDEKLSQLAQQADLRLEKIIKNLS